MDMVGRRVGAQGQTNRGRVGEEGNKILLRDNFATQAIASLVHSSS